MYKVIVTDEFNDQAKDYTGCIEMRISDSGCISCTFYTGETRVYKLGAGEEAYQVPLTDEEILATDGLGDWYREQLAIAEANTAEQLATDTVQ